MFARMSAITKSLVAGVCQYLTVPNEADLKLMKLKPGGMSFIWRMVFHDDQRYAFRAVYALAKSVFFERDLVNLFSTYREPRRNKDENDLKRIFICGKPRSDVAIVLRSKPKPRLLYKSY
jgi:hypothetical protein